VLSDKVGARTVLYWTFGISIAATFILALPAGRYLVQGIDGPMSISFALAPWLFIVIIFVLGFAMSLGKAAVFKHIPTYYPGNVGTVGGLVGMIGGLGGFVLPLLFGLLNELTGIWTSCFMAMFVLVVALLVWMHVSVRQAERSASVPQPA